MATIVCVHGAWMSPRPGGLEGPLRGPRAHRPDAGLAHRRPPGGRAAREPAPELAGVGSARSSTTTPAIVAALPEPPILVGHSFGGLFVQMLLGRGLGRVGVAIHPAPPRGVLPTLDAIRAGFPVLSSFRPGSRVT